MSRVRTGGIDRVAYSLLKLQDKVGRVLKSRGEELSDIAKDLHRNAPRGGPTKNRFRELRSAPGEQPAMESGGLFAEIDQGVEALRDRVHVIVNRKWLEEGTRKMAPRPLGEKAVRELKKRHR